MWPFVDLAPRLGQSPFLFLPMQEAAYENAVSQLIPGKQPEQATLMTDLPRPRRLICSLVNGSGLDDGIYRLTGSQWSKWPYQAAHFSTALLKARTNRRMVMIIKKGHSLLSEDEIKSVKIPTAECLEDLRSSSTMLCFHFANISQGDEVNIMTTAKLGALRRAGSR